MPKNNSNNNELKATYQPRGLEQYKKVVSELELTNSQKSKGFVSDYEKEKAKNKEAYYNLPGGGK